VFWSISTNIPQATGQRTGKKKLKRLEDFSTSITYSKEIHSMPPHEAQISVLRPATMEDHTLSHKWDDFAPQ
jgi:hypothetical protein